MNLGSLGGIGMSKERLTQKKKKLNKNTMKQDSSDITETLQTHLTET